MPSPFPGTDPYLEEPNLWRDVHSTLTVFVRGALNAQLQPPHHTVLEVLFFPDSNRRWHKHVKIINRERQIISAIEILTPEIKTLSPERVAYLDMRQDYLDNGVHLIEIDLLREGTRIHSARNAAPDAYFVAIHAPCNGRSNYLSFGPRTAIPVIPVPMLPNEEELSLDLGKCLVRAYREGRYALSINYNEPAVPPLSPADAEWARTLTAA